MNINKEQSLRLKGVGILLMIVFHLFYFNGSLYTPHFYIDKIGMYSGICVAFFVFLSGYGLAEKDFITFKNVRQSILHLYQKMWFIGLFFIPFLLLFSDYTTVFSIKNVFKSALGVGSINPMWWYCFCYIFILFTYFIYTKLRIKLFYIDLIILLLFLIFAVSRLYKLVPMHIGVLFYVDNYFRLLPFLLLGKLFSKYKLFSKLKTLYNQNLVVHLIIINLIIIVQFFLSTITNQLYYALYLLWSFVTLPLFILSCLRIIDNKYLKSTFNLLGRYSLDIWLIHGFFILYTIQYVYYLKLWPIILVIFVMVNLLISVAIDFAYNKIRTQNI
jgi:hypothetical protein